MLISTFFLVTFLIGIQCNVIPVTRLRNQVQKRGNDDVFYLDGGFIEGEFYAGISVGTPPQSFFVQVDTGSSDLLIYTSECSICGGSDYKYESSSSFSLVECGSPNFYCESCLQFDRMSACSFSDTYGDESSVEGAIFSDVITVGDIAGVYMNFGGITYSNTNSFEPRLVSGIWGLAYSSLSSWDGKTVFQNIIASTGLEDIFSMCLTGSEGYMTIGIDYSNYSDFSWTSIIQESYYVIQVNSISIGEKQLFSSPLNDVSILDSGTTLLLIPQFAFIEFRSYLLSLCNTSNLVGVCTGGGQLFNYSCLTMTSSDIALFPNLTININNVSPLILTPNQYLYSINGAYCLGVESTGSNMTILGDVFMQNFHVVFDRKRLKAGFGPLSTCPTNVTSTISFTTGTSSPPTSSTSLTTSGITSEFPSMLLTNLIVLLYIFLI